MYTFLTGRSVIIISLYCDTENNLGFQLRSSGLPDPEPGTIVNLNDPMLCLKPVQDVHVGEYGTFESSHREWN
jgi:hypothetical protein